jgi:heme/copper-type cytochrome/quinol oxidase subunit 2
MTAVIQEWVGIGGFRITNTAFLNQTSLPQFNQTLGANLTAVQYQNYQGASDNKTIDVNIGDTVTLYIKSISTNETAPEPPPHTQYSGAPGHGIEISGRPYTVLEGTLPENVIPWGKWHTVTFQVTRQGSFVYLCTQPCSDDHTQMNGAFTAGCGG